MVDLSKYKSHPDKQLLVHAANVTAGIKRRTSSKIAELSAVFHDIGKMNPNFQKKLLNEKTNGYANHAYLSAYAFLSFCAANMSSVLKELNGDQSAIRVITAIVAHHHGDLPNMEKILSRDEMLRLKSFLEKEIEFPIQDFLNKYMENVNGIHVFGKTNENFMKIGLCPKEIKKPLELFQDTQFSFASLISADKEDASGYNSQSAIDEFCERYSLDLINYLNSLSGDSEINRIRTKIRKEAINNIYPLLIQGKRIFSLTSPTGSGKTLMLLSLAGEIIKNKGNMRIIYALPFLSITEQVEKECNKIFGESMSVARIDSKSENKLFAKYQDQLDEKPEVINEIINTQFAEDIFDYPFIITTFVKVFETFLSNKNSTLLKLPNFANAIFLVDEIQSLPPRLYGFFIALLDSFCAQHNSFAIISTATMPNFELPTNNNHNLKEFFQSYSAPPELVSFSNFQEDIFDRYDIIRIQQTLNVEELSELIKKENSSSLVILNTIDDTKLLYNQFSGTKSHTKVLLLNTHFTPNDRTEKIRLCKEMLENNEKVILISTQLIEAGVDIDFPVVYRDMAPLPNVVQSSGRCNRNGKLPLKGRVVLISLNRNDVMRAALIYRGIDELFLKYSLEKVVGKITETSCFELQKSFFDLIQYHTVFATHRSEVFKTVGNEMGEIDFIQKMKEGAFNDIGKFKLIDEVKFGEEFRYFIPRNNEDYSFERLEELYSQLIKIPLRDFVAKRLKLIEVENHIRKMSGQIAQVRIRKNDIYPIPDEDSCFGIYKLSKSYSFENGIDLSNENQIV
ncbi:MAG: CRISPR-associated helicase Cas3 [Stygiobacter sp.]|nr:MAG: CRISPR-associated helicase Cas3 [Stygiobacter sp.]KAF0218135.1 MAG: CRISPR-associated helicase [Ignavibacteria bacterium]